VDVDRHEDDRFMDEAFALAERGRGHTHPNPLVGAVLVSDASIVGRGWHEGPGEPHAEVVALREAGPAAAGSTLYCTLEPCSHHGRTPPCAEALVEAGVRRAVVALQDPNPLVDGRGLARLREAGVAVDLGGGRWEERARAQNAAFVKAVTTGLPLVTYKAALSLDGKVAAAGGDARWISGDESRRRVHAMRAAVDAVMVGAGTVRRDDPSLTVRMVEGRDPVRVVVSRSGTLPADSALVRTAVETPTLVLATRVAGDARRDLESCGVEVLEMGDGDLRAGLALLAERGLLDVLCEGGPGLAGALLREGLVDRVALFVAPLLIGRGAPDLVALPAVAAVAEALRLADVSWEPVGDDLLLCADVITAAGEERCAGTLGSASAALAASAGTGD
jgi:diaminohydroxyphosphoribosylaminopyrimidine deaminase/5-amino-6-(5-phosphoribosylamino)uracil reductase